MAAAVVARFVVLSTSVKASASRMSGISKPSAAPSPFFIRSQNPLSRRIFRSPVEMSSVAVESLFPFHTATATALLTSVVSTAPYRCGWPIDGQQFLEFAPIAFADQDENNM